MNINTIGEYKNFMFFDAIVELSTSSYSLEEKIQIFLNMILAFFPIIEESRLIEYFSFLGLNLKTVEDFDLASYWVTTYVAAGGIMVENRLERSLVEEENSPTYIEGLENEELKNEFNKMHDDISGRDFLK